MLGTKKTWSSLVNWFQINSCWIHCSTLTSSSAGSGKHVPIWHLKVMQEFNFCLCLMLKGILYPEHLNDIMALTYVSEGLEHTVAYFLRQTTICTDFALNCSHNIRWSLPWCDGTVLCPLSQTFGRFDLDAWTAALRLEKLKAAASASRWLTAERMKVECWRKRELGMCDLSSFTFKEFLLAPLKVRDTVMTRLWSQSKAAWNRKGKEVVRCM